MAAIEEIINLPRLAELLVEAAEQQHLGAILSEIITQSRVEFNYSDASPDAEDDLLSEN